jgi:hypothetical protein
MTLKKEIEDRIKKHEDDGHDTFLNGYSVALQWVLSEYKKMNCIKCKIYHEKKCEQRRVIFQNINILKSTEITFCSDFDERS